MDENTGPQLDCPPHMMPPLTSGLPNAGYWGTMACDKVPVWQFKGEVVRVDGRRILHQAPNGASPVFTADMIRQTEQEIGCTDLPDDPGAVGRRPPREDLGGRP